MLLAIVWLFFYVDTKRVILWTYLCDKKFFDNWYSIFRFSFESPLFEKTINARRQGNDAKYCCTNRKCPLIIERAHDDFFPQLTLIANYIILYGLSRNLPKFLTDSDSNTEWLYISLNGSVHCTQLSITICEHHVALYSIFCKFFSMFTNIPPIVPVI